MNDIKVNLDKADNLYETDIKFKMLWWFRIVTYILFFLAHNAHFSNF